MKQQITSSFLKGLALFAVICLSGCDLENKTSQVRDVVISASAEGDNTRAAIADDLSFSWTAGDRIAVWSGSSYYTSYSYESGNQFTVRLSGLRDNYAVYPANIADNANAASGSLKVTLPTEYDFTNRGADYSPLAMAAVNAEGADLNFKHLGGLLRIALMNVPANADNVLIDLGKKINGSFPVTIDGDDMYIVTEATSATASHQVKFLIDPTNTTVINLPVPTGTYESLRVLVRSGNTTLSTNVPDFSWTCERAHGKKFSNVMYKTITINLAVNDWTTQNSTDSSVDLPQASQFVVTGVDNVYQIHNTPEGKALRQTWVLGSKTATVTFDIFSPVGGVYVVETKGDVDKFNVHFVDCLPAGNIKDPRTTSKTKITFEVSAKSTAVAGDQIWFTTTVGNANGVSFNIDSETQLYDTRGFHYFRIDDPLH